LRVQTGHFLEQSVEWAYCFDVHCNSFVPIVLILYVLQFFFIPVTHNVRFLPFFCRGCDYLTFLSLKKDNFLSIFIGNTMYFVALVYYNYITFLGYTALPFLEHTEVFLYPMGIYGILYIVSLFFFNIAASSLQYYFGAA